MEVTNLELTELRDGLQQLAQHKFDAGDPPEKKAARQIVASRVGRALIELRNALENYDERNNDIVMRHASLDSRGQPVQSLDDKGRPIGIEIRDMRAFTEDRKPLLKERVSIPDLKGIDYELLRRADISIDGETAARIGAFLSGEPTWEPEGSANG